MTRRRGVVAAAVAALSLLAGAALLAQEKPGDVGFSYGGLRDVTLQGRVVSLQVELARKYGARVPRGGEPQWALALPEGQYYTFLDTESYRKLAAAKLEGQSVEVKARQFPRSMLLEITEFKTIPAEVVKRRFYCAVCDIHFDDFGPCACCGKEVELAKEKK